MRSIGVLINTSETDPISQADITALRQGLDKLGWKEGRNARIEYRWYMGELGQAQAAALELLKLAPDVILANGRAALAAAQQATRTVPIVFVGVNEPVAQGFVQSLARPGGNITGFMILEPTVGGKWLELLKQIAPQVARVAVMFDPEASPVGELFFRSAQAAAQTLGMEAFVAPVHEPSEIEGAMTMLGREAGGGLILPADTLTVIHRKLIVDLAARARLPAIYANRDFVANGGLASYGSDGLERWRQAADYVNRILHGEKAGDLPVQQPTKFDLVINLKTAKALGLTIPPTLLATADEVIE
jgi:putative ABC transport system substrate-binding protein